ncbi:PadR family transcriptional regulator [Herbiconiux sp. CPCC 203407]|uniref:PadR family transcriptional regulator n=1 Tax=Herbiconiux oxytropis TaxID=2970915 RepID=A0AA41XD01_9MICO|nr:PadR family transcriptional regulator [Herbiconiux oxytropis]MCS5723880.1 PadR family transcriptional regulator [Herbiconiux oxytropis]MCS5725922.1 PadR family transcriptional regulator [Herbiconiux oxytropis]
MSPVFGHGHLRLYLLSLLEESPKHGYELIQALSERFGGTYSPSAGTIYPRLAKLEEEGLVTKSADGRKTVYAITDTGRAELDSRRGELDDIEAELSDSVRRLAEEVRSGVKQAMKSLRADLAEAAHSAREGAKASARAAASGEGWSASATGTPGDSSVSDSEKGTGSSRADVSAALREADLALTEFRQAVRTDLRKASSKGFDPETVARLKLKLTELQLDLRAELRS